MVSSGMLRRVASNLTRLKLQFNLHKLRSVSINRVVAAVAAVCSNLQFVEPFACNVGQHSFFYRGSLKHEQLASVRRTDT
jgi:hypothetical protein